MELSEFLLDRIREDERFAAAESGLRSDDPYWTSGDAEAWERHMTPARVLAECAAKRRIVGRYTADQRSSAVDRPSYVQGYGHALLDVCRFLALPYADHPDYREEWKP